MPNVPIGSGSGGNPNPNKNAWFNYTRIDNYGSPDPYGGFPKPDSNIQCPDGTPITAPASGTVTGINSPDGSVPAWGASVTYRLDVPVNSVATHIAFLHLQTIPNRVKVGLYVNAGDLLGYSGGQKAAGAQKVPVGFALYNGDNYGYGPSWNQYLGSPQLNPVAYLNALQSGNIYVPAGGAGTGNPASPENILGAISPNADVGIVLQDLDQLFELSNPFSVYTTNDLTILGQDTGVANPIDWIAGFGSNLVADLAALTLRLIFLSIGVLILYKVASNFIDFGAVAGTVESLGKVGEAAVAA